MQWVHVRAYLTFACRICVLVCSPVRVLAVSVIARNYDHPSTYASTYTHTRTHAPEGAHKRTHTRVCVYQNVYVQVCVCVCVFVIVLVSVIIASCDRRSVTVVMPYVDICINAYMRVCA